MSEDGRPWIDHVPPSTANVPLLRKVVEWVEAEDAKPYQEREWYQGHYFCRSDEWSCGTKACVAGKIALDAGWVPVFSDAEKDPFSIATDLVRKDGVEASAFNVARKELGINVRIADDLFMAANSALRVRLVAEKIAGERL